LPFGGRELSAKSPPAKKGRYQLRTFLLENATDHFLHTMGKLAISNQIMHASGSPSLVIPRSKNKSADSGLGYRTGTHNTGLQGHHERVTGEVCAADCVTGSAQSDYFGMSGGVMVTLFRIAGLRDNGSPLIKHQGRNGNVAGLKSLLRYGKRLAHQVFIHVHHATLSRLWRAQIG
jgi:hypothetical protein